jgi:hypothetical protein
MAVPATNQRGTARPSRHAREWCGCMPSLRRGAFTECAGKVVVAFAAARGATMPGTVTSEAGLGTFYDARGS